MTRAPSYRNFLSRSASTRSPSTLSLLRPPTSAPLVVVFPARASVATSKFDWSGLGEFRSFACWWGLDVDSRDVCSVFSRLCARLKMLTMPAGFTLGGASVGKEGTSCVGLVASGAFVAFSDIKLLDDFPSASVGKLRLRTMMYQRASSCTAVTAPRVCTAQIELADPEFQPAISLESVSIWVLSTATSHAGSDRQFDQPNSL